MKVNELATKVGVTPDTVRFYTRIGLLKPHKNLGNGYKNYGVEEERRLVFIVKARHLGFSVSEIQEVIEMSKGGSSPCCRVRAIVKQRYEEAQQTIDELQQLSDRMETAMKTWEQLPDGQPTGDSICKLIEMWEEVELGQFSLRKQSDTTR
ncbi:MAG: MerR family transcriptional regulator [Pseudomonadales bacterium]|nr:MerR family transcriptional regulator [Pseudomonadales bacterium]